MWLSSPRNLLSLSRLAWISERGFQVLVYHSIVKPFGRGSHHKTLRGLWTRCKYDFSWPSLLQTSPSKTHLPPSGYFPSLGLPSSLVLRPMPAWWNIRLLNNIFRAWSSLFLGWFGEVLLKNRHNTITRNTACQSKSRLQSETNQWSVMLTHSQITASAVWLIIVRQRCVPTLVDSSLDFGECPKKTTLKPMPF